MPAVRRLASNLMKTQSFRLPDPGSRLTLARDDAEKWRKVWFCSGHRPALRVLPDGA